MLLTLTETHDTDAVHGACGQYFKNSDELPVAMHPSFIEPKIKPIVDLMNRSGVIQTVASCEGHGFRGRAPFVYFSTAVECAQALERYLRTLCWSDADGLSFDWIISGRFNGEFELTFLLHSPELDRLANQSASWGLWGWSFAVWRKKDRDLSILTLKLKPFLLQLGQSKKPAI